jgi:predicted PurR-regulated permease PerM
MDKHPRRASAPLDQVTARHARRQDLSSRSGVPARLQLVAGYAWRLIIILAAVYLAFVGLARIELAVVAVFGALVITAILRPVVEAVARLIPRAGAVAVSMLTAVVAVAALFAFIGYSVAGQAGAIAGSFNSGISRLTSWLENGPLHLREDDVARAADQVRTWVGEHRGEFAGDILGGAGTTVKGLTGLLVAIFCAIFFLSQGSTMWSWCLHQLPTHARESTSAAARAGWVTFEGYVRGAIIVAASNAVIVAVLLFVLRVPLALPLATLVFLASFIPLVGGALSLVVAAVVALAARGPTVALIVIIVVPILGQLEGHVLQPLIMSRSVNLHPVVVILTVVGGGLIGGLLGAVLAVPTVAVTWSVITAFRRRADW